MARLRIILPAVAAACGAHSTCRSSCEPQPSSWTRNLHFRPPSGFWADADWYDLQMLRRLPETAAVLTEMVFALPSLPPGSSCADLGSGSGRCAQAIAAAYPDTAITLIDVDADRGARAVKRVSTLSSIPPQFVQAAVDVHACGRLPGFSGVGFDCIVALQIIRHLVQPPAHYADKHGLQLCAGDKIHAGYGAAFCTLFNSVAPGGHVFIGDHVEHGHPGVFEHCEMLKKAGFCDVDVAWREKDWFVVGARRPQARERGARC